MKALALVAGLALASPAPAVEKILDFHSAIAIAADGELTVLERITVQVEGRAIQRGILRDFPTTYRDRFGNKVTVPLRVQSVMRDGSPENFSLEELANGTRIRVGRHDVLLPHGPLTYEIAYRTARQIGFFDHHDELYWNVNGNGWTFAFERLSAEVRLPQAVPAGELKVEAYTGAFGTRGRDYQGETREGAAFFRATRAFAPGEGMTIVVAFPKGIVLPVPWSTRVREFAADNPARAAGVAGFSFLLAFVGLAWWFVGRDPRAGPAFPRYEAPFDLGPAGVRYVDKHGYDGRCFAAALLGLGSRGYLTVRQRELTFEIPELLKSLPDVASRIPTRYDGYEVARTGKDARLNATEEVLVQAMFPAGDATFEFAARHDTKVEAVCDRFAAALRRQLGEDLWSQNEWISVVVFAIGVLTLVTMGVLGAGPWLIMPLGLATVALIILCVVFLMPAYTRRGRKLKDEVDGLRQYLTIAEKDELARLKAPPQTKEEFSRLLPYAVALEVERTWADRFAAALGTAAVAAALAEYWSRDSRDEFPSVERMAGSFEKFGDAISAAETPPGRTSGLSDSGGGGSSSRGSGGGSSGGGGGGGGGSGW